MATTELSALRPPLLQLSALGTVPPPLALHYHPDPFLNRSVKGWDLGGIQGQGPCPQGISDPRPLTASTLGRQELSASSPAAG